MTTDKERLDWLEKNPRLSEILINGESTPCYFYGVAGAAMVPLRVIIDTAMKGQL